MMLIFEGHRENGPATHAAAHAFRARGQQSTRAAKAARTRGAGMHGRAVRAQLTESFQRICALSMARHPAVPPENHQKSCLIDRKLAQENPSGSPPFW